MLLFRVEAAPMTAIHAIIKEAAFPAVLMTLGY